MKKALITGVTGQDGSYLAELLLDLCCCQAICFLDYQGIPGGLWDVCLLRYFVQS